MGKAKRFIITLLIPIAIFLLIGCADKVDKTTNKEKNKTNDKEVVKEEKNEIQCNFMNDSTKTDNITFRFNISSEEFVGINLRDKNIGTGFEITGKSIKNDKFYVDFYYPYATEFKLCAFDGETNLKFYKSKDWENEYVERKIVQQDGNFMIVQNYPSELEDDYSIYVKYAEDGYLTVFEYKDAGYVEDKPRNLESIKKIYEYLQEHLTVAIIPITEDENTGIDEITSDTGICNGESVDISDWTYFNDILARNMIKEGFNVKSSWDMTQVKWDNGYEITFNIETGSTTYGLDWVNFKLKPLLNDTYEDNELVYGKEFKINSNKYKARYVDDGDMNFVVKGKEKDYLLKTISKSAGSDIANDEQIEIIKKYLD